MSHILIVEDDLQLNDGIRLALKAKGYDCTQCDTLAAARQTLDEGHIAQARQTIDGSHMAQTQHPIDLILLDINLPDGNGLDWLVEIRQTSTIPVILISANNMEMDVIAGLELGANDYITKPFSLLILRTRVAVWLREKEQRCIDFHRQDVRINGRQIELSRTEQRLLQKLIENPGVTLSRAKLTDEIWSGESEYVEEHALTVVMKRLRDKLGEKADGTSYIRTVYGVGYVWEKEEDR